MDASMFVCSLYLPDFRRHTQVVFESARLVWGRSALLTKCTHACVLRTIDFKLFIYLVVYK